MGKEKVINYVMNTPRNTNRAVLEGLLDDVTNLNIHICSSEEYDSETGVPTVENPRGEIFYLVPSGEESGDLYKEYIWTNGAWEPFGSGKSISFYDPIESTDSLYDGEATTGGPSKTARLDNVDSQSMLNAERLFITFGKTTADAKTYVVNKEYDTARSSYYWGEGYNDIDSLSFTTYPFRIGFGRDSSSSLLFLYTEDSDSYYLKINKETVSVNPDFKIAFDKLADDERFVTEQYVNNNRQIIITDEDIINSADSSHNVNPIRLLATAIRRRWPEGTPGSDASGDYYLQLPLNKNCGSFNLLLNNDSSTSFYSIYDADNGAHLNVYFAGLDISADMGIGAIYIGRDTKKLVYNNGFSGPMDDDPSAAPPNSVKNYTASNGISYSMLPLFAGGVIECDISTLRDSDVDVYITPPSDTIKCKTSYSDLRYILKNGSLARAPIYVRHFVGSNATDPMYIVKGQLALGDNACTISWSLCNDQTIDYYFVTVSSNNTSTYTKKTVTLS